MLPTIAIATHFIRPMRRYALALCWLRRDLRLNDHAALYHALRRSERVLPVFVFDRAILDTLPRADRRVEFIWHSVATLKAELGQRGSDLLVRHAVAASCIPHLAAELGADAVFTNHDDEPAALARDMAVAAALSQQGIAFHHFKDHVVFERDEVLTAAGTPYAVFTPYKNAWLKKLDPFYLQAYPVARYLAALALRTPEPMPSLAELGFETTNLTALGIPTGEAGAQQLFADFQTRIDRYREARDFPAVKGVSYLSVHLRFGTISPRQLAAYAWHEGNAGALTWLNELIWRDFYHQVLYHRPDVVTHAYQTAYDGLVFPNNPDWFAAWCDGRTGYPLVDAAMRQLAHSGYMHNRLRMMAASFLVKDLLIDWRWGERFFATHLLDYDLAANNGGWQWAASTGCDAQPYFRIFNPITQSQKFDPDGRFIRRYVPELAKLSDKAIHAPWLAKPAELAAAGVRLDDSYPLPIVDHARQRELALALFRRD